MPCLFTSYVYAMVEKCQNWYLKCGAGYTILLPVFESEYYHYSVLSENLRLKCRYKYHKIYINIYESFFCILAFSSGIKEMFKTHTLSSFSGASAKGMDDLHLYYCSFLLEYLTFSSVHHFTDHLY